jgi:FMN-dependent oxidoreductase (nitrilotriacetate monooxygenase family)
MPQPKKELIVNTFQMCCPSQSWAGMWAHPDDRCVNYNTAQYYVDMAQNAERGLLDGIFFADSIGLMDKYGGGPWASIREGAMAPMNDPTLTLPLMAHATKNIGFGVTANLSYEHPFIMARRMSTLDHLTNGRVGWNIVAGYVNSGARATGSDAIRDHDERYDLAEEYMQVVYKLWEQSWDDGAVLRDKANRVFANPDMVREVGHEGRFFKMHAVHMCEPSPQRTPVLYQAGTSTRGRDFAARHAECVFLTGFRKEVLKAHVEDIRARAARFGRDPSSIAFIVGCTVITGPTDAEARDRYEELKGWLSVPGSLAVFAALAGIDFAEYDPEAPIEYIKNDANQSFVERMTILSKGKKWRVRDLTAFNQESPTAGIFLVGSGSSIADQMADWVEATGIDGFNLYRTVEPAGLSAFIDHVVPELQSRGLYKSAYREGTLRNKLFGKGDRLKRGHAALAAE